MIVDCHVHVCATTPGHGRVSPRLRRRTSFLFMRWRLGISFVADDEQLERDIEARLVETTNQTPEIDAAVVLGFDDAYWHLAAGLLRMHPVGVATDTQAAPVPELDRGG